MERLPISKLANSTGQIDGVPANPRTIKKDDYDKLIKSLQEVIRLSDGKDVRQEYLIGMSVPPVMMAQVAHQVYEQLIEVTQ